jgi:hypothetical protein
VPNITIYVSEKDKQIFEQARGLQDSLSKVIAAALKIYLEGKEEDERRG